MYLFNGEKNLEAIEPITFSDLDMTENDIEEILRTNIDIICDEEESMLIVGRQVRNEARGRSDLTAVDNNGNIVVIEIKRDKNDIRNRREAFEFQAIRYAASYATIETPDELVKKIYAPYIEKYEEEFNPVGLTSHELGLRKLRDFLRANEVEKTFNLQQSIILVASDYDEQTLSAVAWLNKNNVNISCYKLIPYRYQENVFLSTEKLLPITDYSDYYVNLLDKSVSSITRKTYKPRRQLPKIDDMLEWGVVKEGDILVAKGTDNEGKLLANGHILADGKEQSLQKWLKGIYGWSSVQTYAFVVKKESGKTLSKIREEYMEEQAKEDSDSLQ